jgi:hypothetical protein
VEVPNSQTSDGNDLRRADDGPAGAAYNPQAIAWSAIDSALVYGPRN